MDSAKPLKRNSRMTHASRIFSEIRRDILSGKLEPGVRIKTVTVSERFGVGLSPLREALNRLASEGLITQSDRRGFSVPQVSEAELADITRTRIELHGLALAASIDQGDSVWEEQVVLAFHRMTRTPRTQEGSVVDTDSWVAAHREFHMSLMSACGSDWMLKFCSQIFEAGERYRHLGAIVSDARQRAEAEHSAIMEAAINRRKDEAISLLAAHYQKTRKHLHDAMNAPAAQG